MVFGASLALASLTRVPAHTHILHLLAAHALKAKSTLFTSTAILSPTQVIEQMQGPQYAMLVHLVMMLSTSNGWMTPPSDDKAYDSSPLSAYNSAITGEVDGGRARRQLASGCSGSWSACPRRARSCLWTVC